ncbi:13714_t:CDS:2 [Entrophospora sp. SA101]|nr:13714_t:CDS:2 [Entrophospora sp. SA101]
MDKDSAAEFYINPLKVNMSADRRKEKKFKRDLTNVTHIHKQNNSREQCEINKPDTILTQFHIEETYKHSVLRLAGSKTIVTDDLKDEYFKKKTINAMISLLKGAVNKINGTHQQPGSNLLAMMGQGPLFFTMYLIITYYTMDIMPIKLYLQNKTEKDELKERVSVEPENLPKKMQMGHSLDNNNHLL